MMQHARSVDEVELAVKRAKFHDVGLCEFDIGEADLVRHALGVAEARKAEIDSEDAAVVRVAREFNRREPRSAAGNERIATLLFARRRALRCAAGPSWAQRG